MANSDYIPYAEAFAKVFDTTKESKIEKLRFETARMFVCAAINPTYEINMDLAVKMADELISKFDADKLI